MLRKHLFEYGRYQVNMLLFLWAGVFLIPCFLMLVFCGIPLFVLETAIGQFCSQGSINVWRAVPIMQGKNHTTVLHIHSNMFHLTSFLDRVLSCRCGLLYGHGDHAGGSLLQRHHRLQHVLHVCLLPVSSAVVCLLRHLQQHICRCFYSCVCGIKRPCKCWAFINAVHRLLFFQSLAM